MPTNLQGVLLSKNDFDPMILIYLAKLQPLTISSNVPLLVLEVFLFYSFFFHCAITHYHWDVWYARWYFMLWMLKKPQPRKIWSNCWLCFKLVLQLLLRILLKILLKISSKFMFEISSIRLVQNFFYVFPMTFCLDFIRKFLKGFYRKSFSKNNK